MHNQESILQNEPHKIFWDFEIKPHPLISAKRPDQVTVNNKRTVKKGTCRIGKLALLDDHLVKLKESK